MTKSAEEIISFQPDLVICPDFVEAEIYEQLRLTGIPVYVYPTQRNLQDIKDSIYHIGEVTGEKERAAVIISDMEEKINAVRKITEKIPSSQRKRVAYFQTNGVYAGRERCFDDLCRAAGLTRGPYPSTFPLCRTGRRRPCQSCLSRSFQKIGFS